MDLSEVPLAAITGGMRLGGSSTFLLNLGRAFRERGLRLPIVVLSEEQEHAQDFAALEMPVSLISRRHNIYEDRLRLAYQELARWRPRAVLACLGANSFEALRLVPPGVARLGIIQSHDPGPYGTVRLYSDWLDVVIGVSTEICRQSQSSPEVARRRIERIPYGIWFAPGSPRRPTAVSDPLRLIYVGRMIEEQKRVSRLIELARQLTEQKIKFRFTFVGSGPQLHTAQAALEGIRGVEFRGEVPNHAVSALLQQHDVLVLLSDFEGLPLSLLEAMGMGVVPVVSDLESGIRDVVTEQNGVRVPVGDVAGATGAIRRLAADREWLGRLSDCAAKTAREEYSAARMAERYLDLIDSVSTGAASWPSKIHVPAPTGMKPPWLYEGFPRLGRRWLKRLLAAVR